MKWVATGHMAAESPEVVKGMHLKIIVSTCQMVGQFHLAGYKWTTPRLLFTQIFYRTTTCEWTLSVLSIYINFEGFFKELDICTTSPESSTEWHMHMPQGLQSERVSLVYTVHPAVVNS